MSASQRVLEKVVVAKAYFVKDLETAMVKATKRDSKAPKWKHVSVLLNATWRRDISISDIGHLLESRLRDSSWSVCCIPEPFRVANRFLFFERSLIWRLGKRSLLIINMLRTNR
jgi:hypothetical protein